MCDVYLYYFIESTGPVGQKIRSMRPATLEAIRSRGEPVMESQIVVDNTQLDQDGSWSPPLVTTRAQSTISLPRFGHWK